MIRQLHRFSFLEFNRITSNIWRACDCLLEEIGQRLEQPSAVEAAEAFLVVISLALVLVIVADLFVQCVTNLHFGTKSIFASVKSTKVLRIFGSESEIEGVLKGFGPQNVKLTLVRLSREDWRVSEWNGCALERGIHIAVLQRQGSSQPEEIFVSKTLLKERAGRSHITSAFFHCLNTKTFPSDAVPASFKAQGDVVTPYHTHDYFFCDDTRFHIFSVIL